jgi:hypothetical protein
VSSQKGTENEKEIIICKNNCNNILNHLESILNMEECNKYANNNEIKSNIFKEKINNKITTGVIL